MPENGVNVTWAQLIHDVMDEGIISAPRGKRIRELLAYQSVVDMEFPLLTNTERKLGYRFAAAEAAWILSGDNRVETIAPYSKEISSFSDDGGTFFGAYGPKIVRQWDYVRAKLLQDMDSRQVVINIWRENPPPSKDIPCSLSVQWLVREDQLHCIYTMRASDCWLGWPYDVFNFTMLSAALVVELREFPQFANLQLGHLSLTAGSQHIYEKNFEAVEAILQKRPSEMEVTYPKFRPHLRFKSKAELITALWEAAYDKGALQFMRAESKHETDPGRDLVGGC